MWKEIDISSPGADSSSSRLIKGVSLQGLSEPAAVYVSRQRKAPTSECQKNNILLILFLKILDISVLDVAAHILF